MDVTPKALIRRAGKDQKVRGILTDIAALHEEYQNAIVPFLNRHIEHAQTSAEMLDCWCDESR